MSILNDPDREKYLVAVAIRQNDLRAESGIGALSVKEVAAVIDAIESLQQQTQPPAPQGVARCPRCLHGSGWDVEIARSHGLDCACMCHTGAG